MTSLTLVRIGGVPSARNGTEYETFKITNGYGNVTTAGVSVTAGVTATVNISLRVVCVTEANFETWKSDVKTHFTNEQWSTLEKNYAGAGVGGGFFAGAFGVLFGGGRYNYYKNTHEKQETATDSNQQEFLEKTKNLQTSDSVLTGTFTVTGLHDYPTEASLYVETTTIKFKDGTTKTVLNTSTATAADQHGNTSGATAGGGPLHIVPVGAVMSVFKMVQATTSDGAPATGIAMRTAIRTSAAGPSPDAQQHMLYSTDAGNTKFMDYTLFGVLNLTGTVSLSPPRADITVKLFGAKVMGLSGDLAEGISGHFNVVLSHGTVKLYLKHDKEVWVKVDAYLIGLGTEEADVRIFSF